MFRLSINLGTLTCWNPLGLFRPVMGQLYIHIMQGHYFIHPIPLLTLCRYFNVCVWCLASHQLLFPWHSLFHTVSTPSTVLSRQFNSHLFCSLCFISLYPFPNHMLCSFRRQVMMLLKMLMAALHRLTYKTQACVAPHSLMWIIHIPSLRLCKYVYFYLVCWVLFVLLLYCLYCYCIVCTVIVLFVLLLYCLSYLYLFLFVFLYWCKDYCHRVTTQLQ